MRVSAFSRCTLERISESRGIPYVERLPAVIMASRAAPALILAWWISSYVLSGLYVICEAPSARTPLPVAGAPI